jgi:hypothetical protein
VGRAAGGRSCQGKATGGVAVDGLQAIDPARNCGSALAGAGAEGGEFAVGAVGFAG